MADLPEIPDEAVRDALAELTGLDVTSDEVRAALQAALPATAATLTAVSGYDRDVLVGVLVYHYRKNIGGCGCGWSELGASHPEHVADAYEFAAAAAVGASVDNPDG